MVARPVATAATALTTEPSWPGDSRPPANQLRLRRSASCTSVTPTPENPGGIAMLPGIGGEAVDVVAGEPGVLDGGEARLDREVERVAVDAPADLRLADAGDDRLALADLGAASRRLRAPPPARRAAATRRRTPRTRPRTGMPMRHVVGLAADDVGGQPQPLLLGQLDDRDHVGRVEVRVPRLLVDREGVHDRVARHRLDRELPAEALRADRATAGAATSRRRRSAGSGARPRRRRARSARCRADCREHPERPRRRGR